MKTETMFWNGRRKMANIEVERQIRSLARSRPPGLRPSRNFSGAAENRLTFDWTVTGQSVDSLLLSQLRKMRDRSRDLCRNDDYMRGFLKLCRRNIVGPFGVAFQSKIVEERTGDMPDVNRIIEDSWSEFSESREVLVTGRGTRAEVEWQAVMQACRDGEVFARLVTPWPENRWNFAVQFIEPDRVDETMNLARTDGSQIRMGVELSPVRRPIAYHVRRTHPGDLIGQAVLRNETERIPSDAMLHVFLPEESTDQTRGAPWLHTAIFRLRQLGAFEDAGVVAARLAASKQANYERVVDKDGKWTGPVDDEGEFLDEVEPGAFGKTPSGWTLKTLDWGYPNIEHGAFSKSILRGIAAGSGLCYSTFAGDLEAVNYSSQRAGALEDRSEWMVLQAWLIAQFERPMFEAWLRTQLAFGLLKTPRGSTLPRTGFEKFNRPRFKGRRWPWVDPTKDMEAARVALALHLRSRTSIVEETGGDFEEVIREVEKEEAFADGKVELLRPENLPPIGAEPASVTNPKG